ncbi:hypothetical protein [Okeania sp. SIO3B5]|nr:hypothetical protein [Okeania sp. SIO3B5]
MNISAIHYRYIFVNYWLRRVEKISLLCYEKLRAIATEITA